MKTRTIFYFVLMITGLVSMSCTNSKEAASSSDTLAVSTDTILRSGRSDANYRFQIELENKTATDSGLYCVLYKYDSAIDRQPIDLKYYRFLTNAVVKDSITDTGIDKVEELITISFYEDNDEQNSSGESSESIEQDTYTMLTGRSGDKLIKPIFTRWSFGFYYDNMEYTSTIKEYFIFPKQKGGVRNQLLFITEMDHKRTDRTDSCIERYYVKRKLLLSNNELKEQTPRLWFTATDSEPVYSYPAICSESNIGTLAYGKKAEVTEQSEIIIEDKDEEGTITRARWIKIKFLSSDGEFGFILNSNPEAVKEER